MLIWWQNFLRCRSYRVRVQNQVSQVYQIFFFSNSRLSTSSNSFQLSSFRHFTIQGQNLELRRWHHITLCTTADTLEEATSILQEAVDGITQWCTKWSQEINPLKSVFTFFIRKRVKPDTPLKLLDEDIYNQKEIKVPGLTLDFPHLT